MKLRSSSALVVLLVSALGTAVPPCASPAQASMARASVSMEEAVRMVEQRFRARVVKAETQRDGDRTVYVLRLLNDSGRVWTVHVDAANGTIT